MQSNRREFLEQSLLSVAAAGLASAAVQMKAQRARAAEDAPASVSPNARLGVAVVGANGRGGAHISGFGDRADCQIVAIVDVDESVAQRRIEAIEKQYGYRPKAYTDMRQAFDDPEVQIASIATPNHWHALATIWAVQAGKDVYVEKPVSHNVVEGRRAVEAARKYQRIVQAGTQSRSNPGMREAIAFLQSGAIGEVKLARGLCYKPRGSIGPRGNYDVPASVNYDLWCGPAPLHSPTRRSFHYDWHWQWDFGNGDLGNQGIHQVDIARWGLGVNNLGEAVTSLGGRVGYEDAGETANTQVCLHEFADDKRLIFEVRGLKTGPLLNCRVGVIFYGTEGYFACPSYNGGTFFNAKEEKIKEFSGGDDAHHFANFVQAVQTRDQSLLNGDIEEGHLSSALCHVGNISYRLGKPVVAQEVAAMVPQDDDTQDTMGRLIEHLRENHVDPEAVKLNVGPRLVLAGAEVFSGEHAEEANPLLTRVYRAPYIVPETADL